MKTNNTFIQRAILRACVYIPMVCIFVLSIAPEYIPKDKSTYSLIMAAFGFLPFIVHAYNLHKKKDKRL